MNRILLMIVLGVAGVAGCDVYTEPARVEVAPATPEVDVYYTGGHYEGPYWVYTDRAGHHFREERAIHERRMREWHEHEHH